MFWIVYCLITVDEKGMNRGKQQVLPAVWVCEAVNLTQSVSWLHTSTRNCWQWPCSPRLLPSLFAQRFWLSVYALMLTTVSNVLYMSKSAYLRGFGNSYIIFSWPEHNLCRKKCNLNWTWRCFFFCFFLLHSLTLAIIICWFAGVCLFVSHSSPPSRVNHV